MLSVLIVSENPERLAELSRLVSASGAYQTLRLQTTPEALLSQGSYLRNAAGLILDQQDVGPSYMQSIEALRRQYADLPCILITQTQQSDMLIRALRAGVSDVLAWPLDKNQLVDALGRLEARHADKPREEARVVAFVSSKGGNGTSFIASNVGYNLAVHEHKRVLLIDLNTQFSDTHALVCDKTPPATLSEVCAQIDRVDDAFLDACMTRVHDGFDILAGASDPIKANEIKKDRIEHILSRVSASYDFVLVDIGQAINPLSIVALDHSDQICVVVQPTIACARTGTRLLDILRGLHYTQEKIRVLVNRHGKHDELSHAALEKIFGGKIFHYLPDDPGAADTAICHGVPVSVEHKNSAIAKSLLALSDILATADENARYARPDKGFSLSKLFLRSRASSPSAA